VCEKVQALGCCVVITHTEDRRDKGDGVVTVTAGGGGGVFVDKGVELKGVRDRLRRPEDCRVRKSATTAGPQYNGFGTCLAGSGSLCRP
jgi:hypothetical protein